MHDASGRTRLGSTASTESRQVHARTGDARSLFAKAPRIYLPEAAMHSFSDGMHANCLVMSAWDLTTNAPHTSPVAGTRICRGTNRQDLWYEPYDAIWLQDG